MNISPAIIQGMEPGPRAKKTTKMRVAAIMNSPISRFCAITMRTAMRHMPTSPSRWRTLLPSLSISGMVTSVIPTMMAPTPRFASCASDPLMPADLKKVTE